MRSVVHRVPVTRARINLGQVVRRVHLHREYFILEKDGIPVAGIMNADEMEDYLDLREPGLKKQIRRSQEQYRHGKSRDARAFLADLRNTSVKPRK